MTNLEQRYSHAQQDLEKQGRLAEEEISIIAVKLSATNLSLESKVNAIEGLLKVQQFWSRKCDESGEGFDEGFILFGDTYVKDESNAVSVLRDYYLSEGDIAVAKHYKDLAVLDYAYNQEESLFTEWDFYEEVENETFYLELSTGDVVSWDEYLESFDK